MGLKFGKEDLGKHQIILHLDANRSLCINAETLREGGV